MIFKNVEVFKEYFKNLGSQDIRASVVKRGWHHFNMQSIVLFAGLLIFNSLEMYDVVAYLVFGFATFTSFIYFNTKRNIEFSEQV